MTRTLAILTMCAGLGATPIAAQHSPADSSLRLLLRLSGGSLNPDDPFTATLSYGAQVGWQITRRGVLLVSGMRQELSRDIAGFPRDDVRRYLALGYEHYFGWERIHRQQLAVRVAGGAVFRGSLGTAPFASGGMTIRYPLSRRFAFAGTIEDAVIAIPDADLQHNFGMFVSLELRQ